MVLTVDTELGSKILSSESHTPRQRKRRKRILATVLEILNAEGYDALTTRRLSQEAGVAPGTLFNLFGTKDRLILHALSESFISIEEHVERLGVADPIEHLMVYYKLAAEQTSNNLVYAKTTTKIILSNLGEEEIASASILTTRPYFELQLLRAQNLGYIKGGVDVRNLSKYVASQHWGITILWLIEQIAAEDIGSEWQRSTLMLLYPVVSKDGRRDIDKRLAALDARAAGA